MSSLAEINQRLIEQNEEQKRTSDAIQDVSKAILTQMKEDRRSKLDEGEAKLEAKREKPKGFQQAFMRSSGLEGLGKFGTGFLAALFGAGSGLATALGTAAGGLIRLGPAALVLSDFVENAFKTLLNNIDDSVFTGFDLDVETKDKIANGAQTALAARFLGVKSPLGLLAAAVAGAYGDELIASLRGWFDKDGDGKIEKFGITLDTESKAVQEGIVLAAALAAPAMLRLVGKGLVWALKKTPVGRVGAALITGISTLFGFAKSAKSAPIPEDSKAINQKMSADAKSTQKRLAWAQESQRIVAEAKNKAKAQPLETSPKVASVTPAKPSFEAGDTVNYTRADGSTVDATVTRTLPNRMTQLQFEGGGKIAVDTAKITPISPVDVTNTAANVNKGPRVPRGNNFNKVMRAVDRLSTEGQLQWLAEYGASKTTGTTSRLLGGAARMLSSPATLAFSFVLGGLFEGEAGDGTLSGILDAQGYALMEAMANGASHSEIKALQKDLQNKVLNFGQVANDTHKALAMLSPSELLNLSNMVYARSTGKIKGSIGKSIDFTSPLSSGRFGMGRAGYGEELSALDAIAAQNRLMGISPVVIQDNSVKSSGGNTSVTNQIDSPVQSHDASWYQRRLSMGLGV